MKNTHRNFNLLCLGDSYTIGEALPLHQSFPYQCVQLLRKKGHNFSAPEIIAKTGWTTDELLQALKKYKFSAPYNFATLLAGVNNQYRGRDAIEYKLEFEELLSKTLSLTGKASHVMVISIPDYSLTTFAEKLDRKKIEKEIDVFNSINKALSIQYKVQYINITDDQRKAKPDNENYASDGLHPSAKQYSKWAKKIAATILKQLSKA